MKLKSNSMHRMKKEESSNQQTVCRSPIRTGIQCNKAQKEKENEKHDASIL